MEAFRTDSLEKEKEKQQYQYAVAQCFSNFATLRCVLKTECWEFNSTYFKIAISKTLWQLKSIGSSQLMTVTEPTIPVVSHDDHKVVHHVTADDLMNFLWWLLNKHCSYKVNTIVVKQTLQSLSETIVHHGVCSAANQK